METGWRPSFAAEESRTVDQAQGNSAGGAEPVALTGARRSNSSPQRSPGENTNP